MKVDRELNIGSVIVLANSDNTKKFEIIDILGIGGSCIAYQVSYNENGNIPHKGILKEYCPAFLEEFDFYRKDKSIIVPKNCKEEFEQGIIDFKNTYKAINEYLSQNLSASNYHTVQLGLYEGNNTVYTLTSCDYGKSYDKISDNNLLEIMELMLSVTKAVEMYHNAGYLHLDIKPKNILVLDDVTDLVKLFDFDSLTSIERLKNREVYAIPSPEDYYVPELEKYDLRNIGVQTDIYEIGAMAYARIFKKNPTIDDVYDIDKIDIDASDFAAGISPKVKYEVSELLKNTLQISRRRRYGSTAELKVRLEKIISPLSSKEPYLMNMPKWQPTSNCVGRQKELSEIKKRLDTDGYIFVKGIGGLGKSEISKMFAKTFEEEYHTVQFCKFNDSLRTLVASMAFDGINDDDYNDFDELVNAKNKILHLCDEHTLIVVDNFNVTYDDFLRDFLPANSKSFKVIFTTRCMPASDYYEDKVFELPKLSEEECKTVFRLHSKITMSEENEELIEQIIKKTDFNTLIIILMACAIRKSGISLAKMLEKLDNQELESIEQKIFHEYDISNEEVKVYNAMYAHLNVIFSVSGLSDARKEILKAAALISAEGLSVDDFVFACDKSSFNKENVYELSEWGWLNIDSDEMISMHPIVSDLIAANDSIKKTASYYSLAEALEDYCNPDYLSHISVIMNRLSCAIQLERRYKNEDVFKRCMITAKLGRMYQNAYYPTEAKKYLLKALNIAKTEKGEKGLPESYKYHKNLQEKLFLKMFHSTGNPNKVILPYIYYFLGEFEKDFGTKTVAIDYFRRSEAEAKKIGFGWIMLNSKVEIAECYANNNNLQEAYKEYVSAFKFAKLFQFKEHLTQIATAISKICAQLELESEELKYRKYADKYRKYASEDVEFNAVNDEYEAVYSDDYEESLKKYELFLAKQREALGEASPMYKTLSKNIWIFYALNNQKEQALRALNESVAFISSTYGEDSMEMAEQLSLAAQFMPEMSEFENAYRFANRAVDICKRNNEINSYTYCSANLALANVAFILGKVQEAEAYINEIDFSLFSGNDFLEDLIQTAGMILANLSKYDELESMCISLLSKKHTGDTSKFMANILMSIVKEQQGHLEEAERYANASKRYIENIKTAHIRAEWMISYYRALARLDFRRGKNEAAVEKINELLKLFNNDKKDKLIFHIVYVERGLYYSMCGSNDAAMRDFEQCEKILKHNHCPEDSYILLYNNIAINYQRMGEYEKAMDFLNKAARLMPNASAPSTYHETILCANIGWLSYLLGDIKKGEEYLNIAIQSYEKLGVNNSNEYFAAKCNLANVYVDKKQYEDAIYILLDMRRRYSPVSDASGEYAINTCEGILRAYLESDQAQAAYDFACKETDDLARWFGKYSLIRINEIINIGGIFRVSGYRDCYDFFMLAAELLYDSEQTKTVQYALILNYIGVCKTDYEKKHVEASRYFDEAKELFEELGETDNENYRTVLNNIKGISDLKADELLRNYADTFADEDDE